jgi:hypothetical protein
MEGNPMTASISSLTALSGLLGWPASSTSTSATTTTVPSWSDVRSGVLSAVSTKLGISQSDLTTQLKTGKSMSQIATAAGVSSEDLTSTIEGALAQSGLPSGINFAAMATRMANNVNNASIDDSPATAAASTTPTTASSTAGAAPLGIDTSALLDANVGGLSLDPSEVSVLLGGAGSNLDTYL